MTENEPNHTAKINKIIMQAVTGLQDLMLEEELGPMDMDTVSQVTAAFGQYLCVAMGHDERRNLIARKLGVEILKTKKDS